MKSSKPKKQLTFRYTRRAIDRIKQPSIRNDFAQMVDGLEFCFAKRQKRAALRCADALLGMAIGLNRTISPSVTTGILDGLLEDGKQDALFLRMGSGLFEKHKDHRCHFDVGCLPRKRSTCHTLGIPGCGGPSGFFFPWSRSVAQPVFTIQPNKGMHPPAQKPGGG